MTIEEALQVLSLAQHRGVHLWRYDDTCRRVLPEDWNGLDEAAAPNFTPWEAVTLARGLVGIGAVRAQNAA
jgi:hypothetical protein